MTPEEFTAVCKRLFGREPDGYGWKAEMHRRTGAPLRTIVAWASEENPIPAVVAALLRIVDELTKEQDNA
jgi:hypothetical protein